MNSHYYGGPCTDEPPEVSDDEELEDCFPDMTDAGEPTPYPEDLQ